MSENEDKTPEDDEEIEHIHRWSLIKDREFYELSDLVTRYLTGMYGRADCPHTDSPLVDAVETLAYLFWQAAPPPVREHPMMRSLVMELMQQIGTVSFCAGIRFQHDGHKLDGSNRFMEREVIDQPESHRWNDSRAENVREWREDMRENHYRPDPANDLTDEQRAVLEQMTGQKIPKGARVLFGDAGGFSIGVPRQQSGEFAPGTGNYL